MKINNLKINNFGKLENKEINFKNNINLIYGENESGKTTLLKFISGMFYGISKNKNKKEFSDFERFNPWNGEEFSGKINYILDNNKNYEIFRNFSKKNPKVFSDGEDVSKDYHIDKNKGSEFFLEQTGIDEAMFLSTSLVEQKNVVLDSSEQSILTQRIANILSTGEENTSYKKTKDLLNKKLVEEVGTERTVGRPLNEIENKLRKISEKQRNIDIDFQNQQILAESKKNNEQKINQLERQKNIYKTIQDIKTKNSLHDEKILVNKNLIKDEKNKVINLENLIKENNSNNKNKKSEKNNYLFLIFLILLILINLILFIFKINKIINYLFIIFTTIFSIFIIIKKIKNKKQKNNKNNLNKKYLDEINLIKNNINKIEDNIKKINNEKLKEINLEKNKIKNNYTEFNEDEINSIFNKNINEIILDKENIENEISSIKLKIHTNDIDYNNIMKEIDEKAKLDEQLKSLTEEKQELLKLEETINLARDALDSAYTNMSKEVTPKFTKNLSNIVEKISNNKYSNIKFIDGEGLVLELDNGEYVNANKLSIGTIDQLYLSLRLSASDEITKETLPIILDETFAYYDNFRLENILKYLNEIAKDRQVIIFTCSNREKETMEKNGIKFNYICL